MFLWVTDLGTRLRNARRRNFSLALILLAGLSTFLPAQTANPHMERLPDGLIVHLQDGDLRLQVITPVVVRVQFAPAAAFFERIPIDRVAVASAAPAFRMEESPSGFAVVTDRLRVNVDRTTGAVSFADAAGQPILAETAGGRKLQPAEVQGEKTFHVRQQWQSQSDESLYGLGQSQLGIVDLKGYDIDLWQHNTNVVVPFLVSSKGYGILWENTSYSRFGDLRPFTEIPATSLLDAAGTAGGLTVTPAGGKASFRSADLTLHVPLQDAEKNSADGASQPTPGQSWVGSIVAPSTGDYQFRANSNGGIRVWLDGKLVMEHWRQQWLPGYDQVKMHLDAGQKIAVRVESDPEQQNTLEFRWKTPAASADTSFWSEVGDGLDYTFVYGPTLDQVIAGYRLLTGKAPIPPNWAFGLWQSYQRYETAEQSLDVVKKFRARKIPFDNIVQDWQYWHVDAWGSHSFDPARFPDPDGWIRALHEQHVHLMISVWGKFNPNTEHARQLAAKGYLYRPNLIEQVKDWLDQPYTFYDAFNPAARKMFWAQVDASLFSKGVDAWWMDATEPDLLPSPPTLEGQRSHLQPTFLGTGARMLNGYALENSQGVDEGQRAAAPNQRVFILTRSGFAGIQRYSTAVWSGDITSTWTAMQKQIAAGLGASISGLPYWTMDTGGYTLPQRFAAEPMTKADEEEWRELNARWFELSTFTPLLRVHGELRRREMWTLGEGSPAYNAELSFDRLRYALQPYIYSMAGWSWQKDYTMLRPLVMDFAGDPQARERNDEFLFGPALLVAPIVHYRQRERTVYLPPAAQWYDYWTGTPVASGEQTAPAPYERIPVFVRAGSILPYGPEVQYVAEKPADPITLFVYAGADGAFTLYEDQGTTNDYQNGAFTQIPIRWNDASKTLTVGARAGSFPGMLEQRTFRVVLIAPAHPGGFPLTSAPAKTVSYAGAEVKLQLE